MEKYTAIKEKATKYKQLLNTVDEYRSEWAKKLKKFIIKESKAILDATEIDADVDSESTVHGLEAVTIKLGMRKSGIYQKMDSGEKKAIWKDYGSLIFGQLFNGKVQVWMTYPILEGLMEPKPPRMIGIYAPPEFNPELVLSNIEFFLNELIAWEDYDDDKPGDKGNAIGFGTSMPPDQL